MSRRYFTDLQLNQQKLKDWRVEQSATFDPYLLAGTVSEYTSKTDMYLTESSTRNHLITPTQAISVFLPTNVNQGDSFYITNQDPNFDIDVEGIILGNGGDRNDKTFLFNGSTWI